ncbi:MAG: hypothetical protein RLZ98_516 [Pseudomonadota bacterium]|jgi:A/G-specific adenine glycosylase
MTAVARKPLATRAPGPETARNLLAWYDQDRRHLPWRYGLGEEPDPYRVWVSEIMLQQTTVRAVKPYFEKFTARWPTVADLARAPLDDVLAMWAGLGYYSRARNLVKCARVIVDDYAGVFPSTEAELRALPGIGPYTAAAIAAIAFGAPATPVDGNVERIVARLFGVEEPLPAAKSEIRQLATLLTPAERPGDFAQAMMDLGASICTPKSPSCMMCPLSSSCHAHALGLEKVLPARVEKPERPHRVGIAFLALREDGMLLLRRRPNDGLLGGMMEIPSTEWSDLLPPIDQALRVAPIKTDWWQVPGTVTHVFTHFRLELIVYRAIPSLDTTLTFWADPQRCKWVSRRHLDREALPSVMRKVIAHGLKEH